MTKMWSQEYWTKKGDVKLYMFRKRVGAPVAGEEKKPILFLVHGSSFSARAGFDLHVPGKTDYSLMEKFAEYGFDVWTMDHEGYGMSDSTNGNSPVAEGVHDLKAGMEVIERETGQSKISFYGSSSGALRAGAFCEAYPEHGEKLVLDAFVCDPTRIQCPTMIIRGEHDGIATEEDLLAYYSALPVHDKQFTIIPGMAHVSHLGVNRARFWHVLRKFLETPERIDTLDG
jgi:pimeloyl-ACP methyl ester carboxylesterase